MVAPSVLLESVGRSCFSGQRFRWDIIVAQVAVPILGADFFVRLRSTGEELSADQ